MFGYVESIGSKAYACTREKFYELIRREDVSTLCRKIAEGDKGAKRRLPAFCFHATFNANERRNENAIPSGLFMLDIDHVENPQEMCKAIVSRNIGGIMIVHITPSGKGVRIVAVRQEGLSIEDNQMRLSAMLGLDFDTAVKDLARLSFCVPESYFWKIDDNVFNDDYVWDFAKTVSYSDAPDEGDSKDAEGNADGDAHEHAGGNEGKPEDDSGGEGVLHPDVDGGDACPAGDTDTQRDDDFIISTLIRRLGGDPVEGERNIRLFAAARYLRYIYDFNPEAIARRIPHYGMDDKEVLGICTNACRTPRAWRMPPLIQKILQEEKRMREEEPEIDEEALGTSVPPLPELMKIFVDTCPDNFKPAMICTLLPILGTLATNVRCEYIDRKEHSLSFMSVIVAPQASGKSFTRMPVKTLLEPIRERDIQARLEEQAYIDLLKGAKNKREQPADPHPVIRIIPVAVSVAKLLKRLDNANRQHLFSYTEEIDTLTKTNKAGAWAQKSDIYRLAFDNGEYGQDYMSDTSYSTIVHVYYNLLLCGTPAAVKRFFKDVEDGLVTRVIFSNLPDMFAADMPIFGSLNASQKAYAAKMVKKLEADSGTYKLRRTQKCIAKWLELKRDQAMKTQSLMIDVFRKRAAVIGYRAGVIAYLLCDKRETAVVTNFAVWVAEYVCRQQCEMFGAQVEKTSEEQFARGTTKVMNLYNLLPADFTKQELIDIRLANFQSADVRMVIKRWKDNGLIKETKKNTYKKIAI